DLAILPRIPRFSIWCGTRLTDDWHLRFGAEAVVYGHLHIRATHYRDGVRFEESSLGYPQNWDTDRGIEPYLRQILPHGDADAASPPRSSHPDY
ncbi:MAG TPA: metallophosphoesterase, partial [Thermoanaerobaculia bacterium]|nr:metallophosphoesterase [Thermoanaerobaculia bacterium]